MMEASATIPLWPGLAPQAEGTSEKDTPTLKPYLPAKAGGPTRAVIICPGGSYQGLAVAHEGFTVAKWFCSHGVAAFVLRYRLPGESAAYRHPVPLLDVQRAIRFVRHRAEEWNIDPHKVALMGFSAGGHLASTAITRFDEGDVTAADPVDRENSRPDFAVLVYPVISLDDTITHSQSRENLLGPKPDPALVLSLSNETQVQAQTPPTLLVHAIDDVGVPVEHSRRMHAALKKGGVPTELHEYPTGGHGFGYGVNPYNNNSDTSPAGWLDSAFGWLEGQGFKA